MVKKLKQLAGETEAAPAETAGGASLVDTVRGSASQIWLAGLGAFSKTQEEGTKVFEALVKEGKGLEAKTRKIAERKFSDVTERFGRKTDTVTAKATASWDKLEQVFEDRVARALGRLGVPTQKEIQALTARVEELTASVSTLTGGAKPVARKVAKSAPAKTATRRKSK